MEPSTTYRRHETNESDEQKLEPGGEYCPVVMRAVDPAALHADSWLALAEKFDTYKDSKLRLLWWSIENDYLLDVDDVIQQTFNALAKLAAAQMGYHGKQPETFFLDCLRAANMALVRKGIGMYSRIGIDASVDLLFQVAANYCRELESRRLLQMAHLNARPSESTNSAFGENRSVVISDSSATTE